MTENLDSAVTSLTEQTKKLDIANFYTHGDVDKAKKMVAGTYKDLYAIKITFSATIYGAVLIFYNPIYQIMMEPYLIVTPSFNVDDMKTTVPWRDFENDITDNLNRKEHDSVLVSHMTDELAVGLNMPFATELKKLIDMNDAIAINRHFMKLVQNRLGFQKINISVDYEPSSSLEMELDSTSSRKIDERELNKDKKAEKDKNIEVELENKDDPLAGKDIKLILQGSLVLSPIKGKEISSVMVGDRVMIIIIDSNPKAVDVARAFNAYHEEKIKPIPGRIVSMKHMVTGGFKIFAIVAKGIFIKIEEEEENIKIAMDPTTIPGSQKSDPEAKAMWPLILVLSIVFILLIALIVFFVSS